jgi:osmotically-inducible protein OsmY
MTAVTTGRTDEQIQRNVLEELKWDPDVDSTEVGVSVKDKVVTLTGWVDSYAKRSAAERAAHRVRGVLAVAHDIEVHPPSAAERNDTDVAAAVTRALEQDAFVPIERLDVTVSKGCVTLDGDVAWEYQSRAAERAVRRLAGVVGVTNLITVQPWIAPAPSELKRRIEEAIVRNAETDAERVNVDISDAKVILTGRVRSGPEREEAERVAWSSPGVSTVDNRIMVIP